MKIGELIRGASPKKGAKENEAMVFDQVVIARQAYPALTGEEFFDKELSYLTSKQLGFISRAIQVCRYHGTSGLKSGLSDEKREAECLKFVEAAIRVAQQREAQSCAGNDLVKAWGKEIVKIWGLQPTEELPLEQATREAVLAAQTYATDQPFAETKRTADQGSSSPQQPRKPTPEMRDQATLKVLKERGANNPTPAAAKKGPQSASSAQRPPSVQTVQEQVIRGEAGIAEGTRARSGHHAAPK